MAVSLIPVVHTSDAKPKGAWIFMNVDVDIGHHAAPDVTVCWYPVPPCMKETQGYHKLASNYEI